jgi:hypothetical protein
MKYRARIRFQGTGVLRYYGSPFVTPALAGRFNAWHQRYGVWWDNVNQFMPTWAFQRR